MKQTQNKIIIVLLFLISLINLKAENLEVNLIEFATFTSSANNVNILLDDELRNENIVFIINDENSFLLEAFEKAVSLKGLELVKTDKFYYVRKKDIYIEDIKYRPIKLNFVNFEDIKNFLLVYGDSIKFEFIKTNKTLLIASKEKEFNSIYQMISAIDKLPKSLKLRVTIIETNLNKLKELGSNTNILNLSNLDDNFFFNLISYPFTVKSEVDNNQRNNFYTFLKLLNQHGSTQFISNPVLTLSDENKVKLEIVNEIPFQNGKTEIANANFQTTTSYDFKSVGLQINILPHIYSDNNVYLDLDLNVSNLVSNNDNLPQTTKNNISQRFHLTTGKLFVLTGLNRTDTIKDLSFIPLLSDIPALGWLFKYESTKENNTNLSVVFELISEEDYTTNNFAVIVPNDKF